MLQADSLPAEPQGNTIVINRASKILILMDIFPVSGKISTHIYIYS